MNKEKKEIEKIMNEIDTIMFGEKYKKSFSDCFDYTLAAGCMGILSGIGVSIAMGLTNGDNLGMIAPALGTLLGGTSGYFISKNATNKNICSDYKLAYLYLEREKQIEVLKLSKKLLKLYYEKEQKERNRKNIKKHLQKEDYGRKTMFDEFELNHPQFKLLTKEEIENTHKKGKLTPFEKFNEWNKLNYCPASVDSSFRCSEYETCRDCTVAWASEKEEWDKIDYIPLNMIEELKDANSQLIYKKTKDMTKSNF